MIGNQFVINLFIRFPHNVMTEHTIKSISMVRSIPLIPFLNEKYNVYKMHIIHKISSEYAKKDKPNFFSANKLKGNNTMKNAKINWSITDSNGKTLKLFTCVNKNADVNAVT